MWFSTVNSYWLNNVFMYWRKWKETDFFFLFFLLHCNPDLTFKWKSQQIMTCPYLTEPGLKVFERQRGLYLNGKVAPETHNATGLWLSLEPESWTVTSFTVLVTSPLQREWPKLWLSSGSHPWSRRKQKNSKRNCQYLCTRGAKHHF